MKHLFPVVCFLTGLLTCPILVAQDELFVIHQGGRTGYIDRSGRVVIPPTLERTYVLQFSDGMARFAERVQPEPEQLPYRDQNGKVRLSPAEKWGFINASGRVAIPATFDAAKDFAEGVAAVGFDTDQAVYNCLHCTRDSRWGFIDKQGRMVIPPEYHWALSFAEGLAAVRNVDGKWGYINHAGGIVIPFQFDYAASFSEGMAVVGIERTTHDEYGYIDTTGRFVVEPQFNAAHDFSEGLALVRVGGDRAYIRFGPIGGTLKYLRRDGTVALTLPSSIDTAADFSHGFAAVQTSDGTCGYIRKDGTPLTGLLFRLCDDFSDGLAYVKDASSGKYLDTRGHVALELPAGYGGGPFKNGLARVTIGRGAEPAIRLYQSDW